MKESLRDIAQRDAQPLDYRSKPFDVLTKFTERNEFLVQEQMTMKKNMREIRNCNHIPWQLRRSKTIY